jgi:predicted transposase/invertase (TIGR01784 family)
LPPESDRTKLYEWLRFLRTERREDLEMLPRNNPDINKAVGRLLELSADDKARLLYEAREKARRDEASRIKTARRMGLEEGEARGIAKERIGIAKNLLRKNLPLADIAEVTGLTLAKIKKLH